MNAFQRYFLSYLFNARTRQGLLFLALTGLFLSSLALMVIQGIMGGLQRGLVARSQTYHGVGELRFADTAVEMKLWKQFQERGWALSRERRTEVLLRVGSQVTPVVLNGVDPQNPPPFLAGKDLSQVVLGADLASKLKTTFYGDILFIAPGTTDALAGEIPRQLASTVSDYLLTDVMEVDATHAWVRLSFVQNLIRSRGVELWRFFSRDDFLEAQTLTQEMEGVRTLSWEEQNKTLVWALALETKVMLALFSSMALLVALAITTGLMLFFAKIRPDLASFWLLGLSMKKIERLVLSFVLQLSAITCLTGVFMGAVVLKVLEQFGHNLMPDIFVERNFPVQLNAGNVTLSFCIPFLISLVFSLLSFLQFRRENPSFIQLVRGSGESA